MMRSMSENLPLDILSLDDFIAYLKKTGWKRVQYLDDRMIVFANPVNDVERPVLVALPASRTLSDFYRRLEDAVNRLAEVEQTSPDNIIQRIQSAGNDTIYMRLSLPPYSFPSLEVIFHFLQGLRNLVVYSACMEREKRHYFEQPFKEGREQAQHFQFGQTFRGSFGFTIESPVEPQSVDLWGNAYPPLQRRVIERITRGLLSLKRAEQKHSSEEISQNFESGLNANMCNAVIDMLKEIENIEVEYSVRWSPRLEPSPDIAEIDPILLGRAATYYLQEAASHMEEIAYTGFEGVRTVRGRIIELTSDSQSKGTVEISAEGIGKVRFSLGLKEYQIACNAHRDRRTVSAKGTLTREKRRGPWTLVSPSDFKVD